MLRKLLQYVCVFLAKLFVAWLMLLYGLLVGLLWEPAVLKELWHEVVPTLEWIFHPDNWESF